MGNRSHTNLSIIEAVETLSSIADLEFDREVGIAKKHELILDNQKVTYKTVHWFHKQDADTTINMVREIFRVVLHYLRQFYRKEYGYVTDQNTVEGIKTIMVLVGEAAKKLDKYTDLFYKTQNKSVTELKEYKQLQDFYLNKIARKIDEGVLGKWILGLSLGKLQKAAQPPPKLVKKTQTLKETKHVFVDLEGVKKDSEYELFFIRKEDGSRFFNPRLLRNIKLICDFGHYFGEHKEIDPLENIKEWQDRICHTNAKNIIKAIGPANLDTLFRNTKKIADQEVFELSKKAMYALLFSSNSHNLLHHNPAKSCREYFQDFLIFMRDILHSRAYQKWIVYPPKEANILEGQILDFTHQVCRALYLNMQGLEEIFPFVQSLTKKGVEKISKESVEEAKNRNQLSGYLTKDYQGLSKIMKNHPNGPLLKVLEILEENTFHVFDPIMQYNVPNKLFDLHIPNQRIIHLRIPSPIYQEFIHKANVLEGFKGFLRFYAEQSKKHLLINLQDRTSWLEYIRSTALEELQKTPELKETLQVVTLAIDTDFYHQLHPYNQLNHADAFFKQFREHILSDSAGFFFPSKIKKAQLDKFIMESFKKIHKVFFSGKNVLSRENRMSFIDIFYMFLILKIIDWVNPESFSLTCKDAIDRGPGYSASLFAFMKLIQVDGWQNQDIDYLDYLLHGPSLMFRERLLQPDQFNRIVTTMSTIEKARNELGGEKFVQVIQDQFSPLYNLPLLDVHVTSIL